MPESFNYQQYLASREWALKREDVKRRSGGVCERCKTAPHQQTHHLTYERIGKERLEDLLGVCKPCHEYLSGKVAWDPLKQPVHPFSSHSSHPIHKINNNPPRIYCAGKIAFNDWRLDIADIRSVSPYLDDWEGPNDRPLTRNRAFRYMGPFFISCDHGCSHGRNTHGVGVGKEGCMNDYSKGRAHVSTECFKSVLLSDFIFVWLESHDAYGTIWEMGLAAGHFKPILVYYPPNSSQPCFGDMWLALSIPFVEASQASDPITAFNMFTERIYPNGFNPV